MRKLTGNQLYSSAILLPAIAEILVASLLLLMLGIIMSGNTHSSHDAETDADTYGVSGSCLTQD